MKKIFSVICIIGMICALCATTSANVAIPASVEGERKFPVIGDVLEILKHAAGMIELTPEEQMQYDLNHDDVVDEEDAILILKILAGDATLEDFAPVTQPEPEPELPLPEIEPEPEFNAVG